MEPRLSFARAVARKYLRKHRVLEPPVPVEYILVAEGFQVELLPYPDDTAGESWWDEGVGHVAVNPVLPAGRLRFTLAHELGHLSLRHHQQRLESFARLRESYDVAAEPPESLDPIEREADVFAAELLMPLSLFHRDWERMRRIERLAERYEVSHTAAQRRVRALPRKR